MARRGLGAGRAARPRAYSRRTWAVMRALDRLPWPWGEEIMVGLAVADAFVRTGRLHRALAWASVQRGPWASRWSLALALCAHRGRFFARSVFTGIRELDTLGRVVRLEGEDHLRAAGRGVIFLGFHLGPASPDVALRLAGHRVTWIDQRNETASAAWPPAIRRLYETSSASDGGGGNGPSWVRALYRAHRMLQRGESIFITADGCGTLAFEVLLPGRPVHVRAGWLCLRETTGAPVLPVLSHMEGRTQVVTIHPALPAGVGDPVRDREACRTVLARLLREHVRRFPEGCYSLAFFPNG